MRYTLVGEETHVETHIESTTNGAILSDKNKEKPREGVIAVDVVIPAFNGGNCIEGVLHDVVVAKQDV